MPTPETPAKRAKRQNTRMDQAPDSPFKTPVAAPPSITSRRSARLNPTPASIRPSSEIIRSGHFRQQTISLREHLISFHDIQMVLFDWKTDPDAQEVLLKLHAKTQELADYELLLSLKKLVEKYSTQKKNLVRKLLCLSV